MNDIRGKELGDLHRLVNRLSLSFDGVAAVDDDDDDEPTKRFEWLRFAIMITSFEYRNWFDDDRVLLFDESDE